MLSSPPSSRGPAGSERYRVGNLEVDVEARRVFRSGEEVQLTELSFDAFVALLRRAPSIVSKKELMREVWPGIVVEPDTVKKRIALLRESLGDDDPAAPVIRVARGRGYGINAAVERLNGANAATRRSPQWRRITIGLAASALVISLMVVALALRPGSAPEEQQPATGPRTALDDQAPGEPREASAASPGINAIDRVAYQHYLEGKALRRAGGDLDEAARALEQAIDIEPRFAAARAELALCRIGGPGFDENGRLPAPGRSARELAERALELDPVLPEALAAAAAIAIFLDWDWARADALLERGREIAPGNEYLQTYRSVLSAIRGDLGAAIEQLQPVVAHDITYARLHYSLGQRYYQADRYREAIQSYRRAMKLNPGIHYAHLGIGRIYALQGDYADALREVTLEPDPFFRLYGTVLAHTAAGDESAAAAKLEELESKSDGCCNYWVGSLHAYRGSPDAAFRYLESALQSREHGLLDIKIDPLLESIRSDRRYQDLLSAMNLE